MDLVFAILLGIALFLTLGVLFAGVLTMGRGGEFNKKYGNRLMRWRVTIQGVAVLIFLLAFLSRGG